MGVISPIMSPHIIRSLRKCGCATKLVVTLFVITCICIYLYESSYYNVFSKKLIESKYIPRLNPKSDITYQGVDLMKETVPNFDPRFKNPCWYETNAETSRRSLRCLPYVFLVGTKKSGTGDLYNRLKKHPQFVGPGFKEAQWFARLRFESNNRSREFSSYVDMYNKSASYIEQHPSSITGDASPSNLHYNTKWRHLPGNENLDEPRYVILDYIAHLIPKAKILAVFRNPVDRLYSDYYHENWLVHNADANSQTFHELVKTGLALYKDCFQRHTVRSCVYNESINAITKMQMQLSMYSVFYRELTRVFARDKILLLKTTENTNEDNWRRIFFFLDLSPLSTTELASITSTNIWHTRKQIFKDAGPMLEETRQLLEQFYRPFNEDMAKLTNDDYFLFNATYPVTLSTL